MLEKGLKESIRLRFDKDLEVARGMLVQQKKKYGDYKDNLNAHVRGEIKEEINSIDGLMKKRMAELKNNATIGGEKKASKGKKLAQSATKNAAKFEQLGVGAEEMLIEMERLRESEKEARQEVIDMQLVLRRQRIMNNLKEIHSKFQHDN